MAYYEVKLRNNMQSFSTFKFAKIVVCRPVTSLGHQEGRRVF